VGREKRERVRISQVSTRGGKGGRRPLSLVIRQAGREGERRSSMPLTLVADVHRRGSVTPKRTPRNSVLDIVTETPNLDNTESPDTSISQSSYSWASQFSGETDELRAAAHYIKPEEEEEELASAEEEEVLKDGTARRRKKIVALAHTVRQLEGVGSREAEDPALYDTLVKAWNERPLNQSPHADTGHDQSPLPFTPNIPNSRHSEGSSGSVNHDSSFAYSDDTGRRSNSMRYSYASTLHDLAVDGGIEQANRIFLAKPWLRGSIVAAGAQEEFLSGPTPSGPSESYIRGDNRHLSLADAPPPFGLASPIVISNPDSQIELENQDSQHTLRKAKRVIDFTATPEPSPPISESHVPVEEEKGDEATGWGLGFMGGWFGADSSALPTPNVPGAFPTEPMARSETVAQFDDAPNDDSLVDAEGESDPEFDDEEEGEQVFRKEGDGVGTNINTDTISSPVVLLEVAEQEVEEGARPESMVIPQLLVEEEEYESQSPPLHQEEQENETKLEDTSMSTISDNNNDDNDTASPSLNHYQLPTSSTPSITSYPLPLLPVREGGRPQMAVITNPNHPEIQSARGSCHSSDSCSSPSLNTNTKKRGSRPSLTPILTGLMEAEDPLSLGPVIEEPPRIQVEEEKEGEELVKNLRDERFSSAFLLAQSLAVPTPSIKSPTRMSSINVLSMTPPTISSPQELTDETTRSNHYSSLGFSDDVDMSMMGAPPPRARSMSITSNSTNSLLSPTSGLLTVPRRGSVASAGTITPTLTLNHRPSLAPLRSISELGLDPHYDTVQSTSGVSNPEQNQEELDEEGDYFDSRSDLGTPNSPFQSRFSISNSSLASPSLDNRRSRLAQSSLDSLPHMMRPGNDSSSRLSVNTLGERRTSKYQVYQMQQLEKSRRANARVAAKMSGATPKELKELTKAQRSPNIDIEEKVEPPPSRTAAVLFFLGFLGPWFWIFGGWMPMSRPIPDEEQDVGEQGSVMLDFSGAENSIRGWKWTYHPDPWVKCNRRAAAIVIPLLVLGGVGAAVAVALVL
jgi:hypothetical protein